MKIKTKSKKQVPSVNNGKADTVPNTVSTAEDEIRHLISLYDGLQQFLAHLEHRVGGRRKRKRWLAELRHLAALCGSCTERLRLIGVDAMPQETFVDLSVHEPVQVLDTHHRPDDRRILDVVRNGFTRNGRVLRAAQVVVLIYKPQLEKGEKNERKNEKT